MPPEDDVKERDITRRVNMIIVNATTAVQYFHILRAQMRRNFRKPLVVIAPKKLLKFKPAASSIEAFGRGIRFSRTQSDKNPDLVPEQQVKKVIYCTGQVYYDIEAARAKRGYNDIAIIRVEVLSPFPFRALEKYAQRYSNAKHCWAQEEPKNLGCWSYVEPRFRNHFHKLNHKYKEIQYAGRPKNAASCTYYGAKHV